MPRQEVRDEDRNGRANNWKTPSVPIDFMFDVVREHLVEPYLEIIHTKSMKALLGALMDMLRCTQYMYP